MKDKIGIFLFILMLMSLFVVTAERSGFTQIVVQKADMPTKRTIHASCVINGIIYVFGGYPPIASVEAYDPSTDKWTKKQICILQGQVQRFVR